MSNWKVYRIRYSYASDPEKMGLRIANFTVKPEQSMKLNVKLRH